MKVSRTYFHHGSWPSQRYMRVMGLPQETAGSWDHLPHDFKRILREAGQEHDVAGQKSPKEMLPSSKYFPYKKLNDPG
ncbi:hypothetical protein HZH66_013566 [Vespula vulgaris]|uniref:Uncharacterized protein n=1 Tax=Vespula vulgaris TaxID=7454 RepID=A0A834J5G1_VESVU|nr:hypothetical protein HZH66_013566 [Vespula vulgaris]